MISFLNPLFWLGLLAVAAPLWLHLRRKRQTNVLLFSTLRFLDDCPAAQRSPLRLQDLGLLALRILGLTLIVAAFTWPYNPADRRIVVQESRVYLLDNTLSRQALQGFERDRQEITRAFASLSPDVQAAVIELTGQPRVLVGFGEDRQAALDKLSRLAPSFQRGSFIAGFRLAKSVLANSLGLRKRLVFLSDNQANQWAENAQSPPFLDGIEIDLPQHSLTNAPNLCLTEPRAQRIFLGDRSLVNFSVKCTRQGPANQAVVLLRANDQVIFNRPIEELASQPETFLLTAQWESDPERWIQGEVSIEGSPDVLAGDNRAFFAVAPVREGRLALLAQSPYLRLALSPEIMRGHWQARVLESAQLDGELAGREDAEVLVLESHYLQTAAARQLVWRYLTNRRGVILLVDRLSPATHGALRELGFALSDPAESRRRPDRFQYLFTQHPVFHPFLSPDYGNLLEVQVYRHQRIEAQDAMPLVFSSAGEPLFFQSTRFPGKLFVLAFGLDQDQTSWPFHQTFIPFLDLCLQNARPDDPTPLEYEPGAVSLVDLPPDSPVREVVLKQGREPVAQAAVHKGRAQLTLPDRPGLYGVLYDQGVEPEKVFSVNPSAKESVLVYTHEPEAMRLWKIERETARPPQPAALGNVSRQGILQQQFWWWLLLGALAALVLETAWVVARKQHL